MRMLSCVSLSLLAIIFASCTSIVKKPEIEKVHKVALLSVYANEKVPEEKGRGFVKKWNDKFKTQVAEDFLKVHSQAFKKIGWRVVDPTKVLESDAYKEAFEVKADTGSETANSAMKFLGNLAKNNYRRNFFTPVGMHPVEFQASEANSHCYGSGCPEKPEEKLAAFARKLNVDAVAVVQIDFCYRGGTFTSLGGAGEAYMSAATSVHVVDTAGNLVVNMPSVSMCDDNKNRADSTNSMLMNGGDLVFAFTSKDKIRAMFRQSAAASADLAMNQIDKAMH